MNINNVFEVKTVDIKEVFSNNSEKCFYIPAYQRPYSWDKEKIDRTWEDIVYGLEQLQNSDDYITFLGSIITLHDTKHESISPIVRGEVPSKVMVIIDGQQRLTTLLLLIISLDNMIRQKLTKDNEKILGKLLDIIAVANKSYKSPKSYGLDNSTNYPKMIRAYDDQWATKNKEQYNSPIASFLKQYIDFSADKSNKKKLFTYSTELADKDIDSHKKIKDNANHFKKIIKIFLDRTELHQIIIAKSHLLGVEQTLLDDIKDKLDTSEDVRKIFILLLVLRFIFQRIFVADISAQKEEYAFEMFDSLNTTGEPLTAFETFKPKVVEYIKLNKYIDSNSKKYMDMVETYLSFNPKNRNSIAANLITSFALSESGQALSKKLRDQRIYLRDQYRDSQDKEGFIKNLTNVSQIYHIWNQADVENSNAVWGQVADNELIDKISNDDVALTCLQFLSKTNHTISLAVLSRFADKNPSEFVGAIKAITAFFVLWRSVRQGTAGIDNCYRKLMKEGVVTPLMRDEHGIDQQQNKVSLFNRISNQDISLQSLRVAFRHFLYKGATDNIEIHSKKVWLNRLKNFEVYNANKEVCKFLLITAFDGVVSDSNGIGCVKKARDGIANTLDRGFNYQLFESIEHIFPQSGNKENISDEKKQTLGNLTLLPKINNSSIGNKLLKDKACIFKALCSKTQEEQDKILKECGMSFHKNTKNIISESQHFPYLESLSNLDGWNDKTIEKRTENLGSIIWDKLAVEWLEFNN
ncbi:hypothetical protein SPONL_496 [uncultured Candidatus Thioglobus sp.]|nr:hypothetical protein SPONL_496 [uncultured Candidatus Thioglobus sp.]